MSRSLTRVVWRHWSILESPIPATSLPCFWVPDRGPGTAIKAPGGTQLGLEGEPLLDAVQDRGCHVCETQEGLVGTLAEGCVIWTIYWCLSCEAGIKLAHILF